MPVLTATGAGVRRRRRWLFRDLDVTAEPGDIVAVVGPPGSGRTTVLLALARRFRLSAGSVVGSAALGYVPEVTSPEPLLTVREHVRERLLLVGRSPREAAAVPLLGLDPALKGFELSPYQRQVLGLVLARLENPRAVALDGVDEGVDRRESESLWGLLADVAADGIAVLVTAREVDPARVSTSVRLGGPADQPPAESEPADAEPADAEPADVEVVDAELVEAEPVEAEVVDAEPVDAEPVDADVVDAELVVEDENEDENEDEDERGEEKS
ncbi:ATP-binding cassette domain-containing protein [Actinoplanes sp. NPDC049668]|uniref:ATP-binding cassette domain-containing protein n=1 Tax=unclassified Actinoplanes TaxID=2626549 RepID=UPI0033A186EB